MTGIIPRHSSLNSMPQLDDDGNWRWWALLMVTILFEVAGTMCMRLSDGYKNFLPSMMIFVCYLLSFSVFPLVLQHLDLSVAYAIWSALGTALTAIAGFVYFGDKMSPLKLGAIVGIIFCVVLLNYAEGLEQSESGRGPKNPLHIHSLPTVESPLVDSTGITSYKTLP